MPNVVQNESISGKANVGSMKIASVAATSNAGKRYRGDTTSIGETKLML